MSEMVSDIRKSDKLVISQDGWENNSSDPILAHSFFTGEKSYLHNIKDCGSTKKQQNTALKLWRKQLTKFMIKLERIWLE